MEKFTVSEVRDHAEWLSGVAVIGTGKTCHMLRAYADRLEADEKAVPVYQVKGDYSYEWKDCSKDEFENTSIPFKRRILYAHPSPADAERLAEALERTARHRAAADGIDPDRWRSVLYGWEDRALAAHSAQAQPPAVSVPGELAEPSKGILNYEQELSFAEGWNACRKAMLAAQENPNG